MPWTIDDDADPAVVKEIEKHSDRGAALIAGALLEERLLKSIKKSLQQRNEAIEGKMFKGSGPLATFAAKIDLGLLLGIYKESTHKGLHIIRRIRNEFAHDPKPLSFRSQKIKALCQNIRHDPKQARAVIRKYPDLPFLADFYKPTRSPRQQYLSAIKTLLFIFGLFAAEPADATQIHAPPPSPSKSRKQHLRRSQSDYHVRIRSSPQPRSSQD
jgi:DNA-binding MltR family transcriptional regulator